MAYQFHVKEFEGPLEVLLELIESKKLSINEVSLGSVTDEYFQYLEVFKQEDPQMYHKEIAVFLVIAATLMLVKSRSLLAGFSITPEEEADIKELEARLRLYQSIKQASVLLGERDRGRHPLFTRSAFVAIAPAFLPPNHALDIKKMLSLLKSMLQSIPQKQELPQKLVKKIVSIEEKIKELEARIEEGVIKTFDDFLGKKRERLDVIVSFLAMLELIKLGSIVVRQSMPFDLIHIDYGARKSA